ncbi:hypothetical protein QOZ80_6BG0492160 [Eleusine coracana subsp. coracana]|nr:hypothetical protein QOZ80_6BG0492160 [Eleusine coracana subsp. coracana]
MVSEETKPKRLKEEECTINRLPHDCIERIFVTLNELLVVLSYSSLKSRFQESAILVMLSSLMNPRKPDNMQCYICVKSLVQLNAYKKVGIMHGMKQREGWELKKWQPWKREIHEIEDTWRNVYELEQNSLAFPRHLGIVAKEVLQHLSDEVIQQRVTAEVDQILQHLPDCPVQHPRSSRRVNWVERKWDKEKLSARIDGAKDMAKASKQAHSDILRALSNVRDHLQGAPSSAANALAE